MRALAFLVCTLVLGLAAGPRGRAAAQGSGPVSDEQRLLQELSTQGTNVARLYALGDLCHDLGVDGDKAAVVRAEGYLRQALSLESTNARALALLGSVYTMKGRDAFWPTTQLRLVHEGNGYMDRAVSLAPDDVPTRVIRALNNAHMPDFLGRTDLVRADLEWLWERVDSHAGEMSIDARQNLALHWGRQLKRLRRPAEARPVWEKGQALAPESTIARQLAAELAKLP